MERWVGRVAIVTGAGSGIGEAVAIALMKHGLNVVGVDLRNHHKIEISAEELRDVPGKLYAQKADVSEEDDVFKVFNWVRGNLGRLDIVVNSAGIFIRPNLLDFETDDIKRSFDINVIGLSIFTREAIKYMREIGVDDGHIVNVASLHCHFPPFSPRISVYCASKHAVRVLSEGLRRELVQQRSKIRVTNLSPGCVDTEILRNAGLPNYEEFPKLLPEDIANAVIYAVSAPPHVQVHEITIRPVGEEIPYRNFNAPSSEIS